jgi:hypothetical protein
LSMLARAAAARTMSHSTFGDMPFPQTRPALLIARKTDPVVMAAAAVHASTADVARGLHAMALASSDTQERDSPTLGGHHSHPPAPMRVF